MTKKTNPWDDDDANATWISSVKKSSTKQNGHFDSNSSAPDNDEYFSYLKWGVLAIVLIWLASGFYQVQPNEEGVVLRFGAYYKTTTPGLRYHIPAPFETVRKVNITQERSINLGVSDVVASDDMSNESHILTGDENIVDINLTIVWRIENVKDYLFNLQNPDQTVRVAAQSVLREIVGQSEMLPIISGDRGKIEDETMQELQAVLNDYGAGIKIVRVKLQKADPPKQVVDAFNEVQRAKADMERFKNEAEAYRNEILPKSKGEAAQRLEDAKAYKSATVNKAQGEAQRFLSVYNSYKMGKDITIKRLYLETMEDVLANSNKVILNSNNISENTVPYLPLNQLNKKN